MALPEVIKNSRGNWQGKSKLHISWKPEGQQVFECDSTLQIAFEDQEKFANLAYTWSHEGEPQFGAMLINGGTAGWTDTWHQGGEVMRLQGEGTTHLSVTGEYSWEGSPPWGWRSELSNPAHGELMLTMTNISPDGTEEWAVSAVYHRA